MLKIRLQRVGRINVPAYRIIVVEHTEGPKTGKFTDIVGTYNPRSKERKLDEAKIKHWMSVGAQPSPTVHNMLVSAGILNAKKINILPKYKAPAEAAVEAKQEEAEKAAEAEAKAEAKAAHDAEVAAEAEAKEAAVEAAPEVPEPAKDEAPEEAKKEAAPETATQ